MSKKRKIKKRRRKFAKIEQRSIHTRVKDKLVMLGGFQGLIAKSEYDLKGMKLDVVWLKVRDGFPTYVFEVQIGGDPYHAISKLKHAHDIWNSKIFLVTSDKNILKVQALLSGAFHEIKEELRVLKVKEINELYRLKKAYRDYESKLGLI